MILGDLLVNGAVATSPWFERFGDAATFFCEVLVQTTATNVGGESATAQITVAIETKNCEDDDDSATQLAADTSAATGVFKIRAQGFKELVRFAYAVAYAPELDPAPEDSGFIQFRMLPPAWEDNCMCGVFESTDGSL